MKDSGKSIAPYDRGPERLLEDLHLAIAQYNGTAQDGDLQGRSPIFASPKTVGHSPNARLVVTMTEVCS